MSIGQRRTALRRRYRIALRIREDDSALRALNDVLALPDTDMEYPPGLDGNNRVLATQLLFEAISVGNEVVARATISGSHRASADVNLQLQVPGNGETVVWLTLTAAGLAIKIDNPAMLIMLVELGAVLDPVCFYKQKRKESDPPIEHLSAMQFATMFGNPNCLEVALNASPDFTIDIRTLGALYDATFNGPNAVAVFKVLAKHKTILQMLEFVDVIGSPMSMKGPQPSEAPEKSGASLTAADCLLSKAQLSGNDELVSFLVKDLGIRGKGEAVHVFFKEHIYPSMKKEQQYLTSKANIERLDALSHWPTMPRFFCASCRKTCATKICQGCKKTRYCSEECQTVDWKSGHEAQCVTKEGRRKDTGKIAKAGCSSN